MEFPGLYSTQRGLLFDLWIVAESAVVELADRVFWLPSDFGVDYQTISWDRISTAWLHSAAKRWLAHRLNSGAAWRTVGQARTLIGRIDEFFVERHPTTARIEDVDRPVLEDLLGWTRRRGDSDRTRSHIGMTLDNLLSAHRRLGWARIDPTASYERGELPWRDDEPRPLSDHVLQQVADASNLDRATPVLARMVTIALHHGLRVSDTVTLAFDCLGFDTAGNPILRWGGPLTKGKNKRPVPHPIMVPAVVQAITAQQGETRRRFPSGTPWLFPRDKQNLGGSRHARPSWVGYRLRDWVDECGITDEYGRKPEITYHRLRHSFGTRLVNEGISIATVKELMGHGDVRTTSGYAQLHTETVRRELERNLSFTALGTQQAPDPEFVAIFMLRTQEDRAVHALPNEWCTRPPQQECDHMNACLTCPTNHFRTGPDFLPVHRAQLDEQRKLVAVADSSGHFRWVEKLRQHGDQLERLIVNIEDAQVSERDH